MGSGRKIEIRDIEDGKLKVLGTLCTTIPYFFLSSNAQ